MGRLEAAVAAPDEAVRVSPGSKEAAGAARQAQAVASARSRGNALFTDRVGQRPLLLVSTGGMTVSLLVLGSVFAAFAGSKDDAVVATVAVAALVAFVCTFSVGLGPLAWVYSSEILLLRLRGQGAGLGTAMNRVMSGIVTMTFISLYGAITMAGTFYLYTAVAAASFVFIYACLPETRGRNLEDIEQLFRTK